MDQRIGTYVSKDSNLRTNVHNRAIGMREDVEIVRKQEATDVMTSWRD